MKRNNTTPNAPDFSANIRASYTLESKAGSFALNVNDSYKAGQYWEPDNRIKETGYHIANASVTWQALTNHFSVEAFIKNIGGAVYYAVIAGRPHPVDATSI